MTDISTILKNICIVFIFLVCNCSTSEKKKSNIIGELVDGKKEGVWKIYDSSGAIREVANYKNDSLNGVRITYYDNGTIYTKGQYKMGIFVGSFFLFFRNGQIQSESWFDSLGREQGLYKIYYESGQLRQIGHVINGQYEDSIKTYYDNNQPMYLQYFKHGKKEGIFKTYDEQGNIIKLEYYKSDSLLMEKLLNRRKQNVYANRI